MSEYCDFEMIIVGNKIDIINLKDAIYLINGIYKDSINFYDEEPIKNKEDDRYHMVLYGDCSGSIQWSMIDDCHGITIQKLAKDYSLDIEIYATTLGDNFAEHYYIEKGEILIDECEDYEQIYIGEYESKEEAENELEEVITNYEWNNNDGENIIRCKYFEPTGAVKEYIIYKEIN